MKRSLEKATSFGAAGPRNFHPENGKPGPDAHEPGASMDLVATNDIHYILAEDAAAHDILLCIQTGKKVSDEEPYALRGRPVLCEV